MAGCPFSSVLWWCSSVVKEAEFVQGMRRGQS